MSILLFLGVLFVLVLVHELGHFAVAKWTGMRVDEFGIGFPPKLFGIRRGETEYTLNLLPIGGFVKIFGEDSVGVEDDVRQGSFTSKSKWAQSAVLVAGVAMNVLFAWFLIALVFSLGVPTSVSEEEAGESARLVVSGVLVDSPAFDAGLPQGAVIERIEVEGDVLTDLSPSSFTAFIGAYPDTEHTISYTIGGNSEEVKVTPERGVISSSPDQVALGVSLAQVETLKRGFVDAVTDSFVYVITGLRDITVGIGNLLFDTITMRADFSQVAGPVGIVGLVGDASEHGITTLLMFTAFISLNLAVINILPFPALDGGRLVMVGIEALKGSPIKAQYVAWVNMVGFLLLMLLMVVVTWNDIARLL